MSRPTKISPESVEFAGQLLRNGVKTKKQIRAQLCKKFKLSDSTARKLIKAGQTWADENPDESTPEPEAESSGDVPTRDEMKRRIAMVNLKIVDNPKEYAKNKIAASKVLISTYKLNEKLDESEHLSQVESDAILGKALCKILNIPLDSWFILNEESAT